MAVRNLELSAQQIGKALGVCDTAASRKVSDAEALLAEALTPAALRLCRTTRPDRLRTAVAGRLRTVAAIAAHYPEHLEPWIARLIETNQGRTEGHE